MLYIQIQHEIKLLPEVFHLVSKQLDVKNELILSTKHSILICSSRINTISVYIVFCDRVSFFFLQSHFGTKLFMFHGSFNNVITKKICIYCNTTQLANPLQRLITLM